jgi:hypothetical protein
VDGIETVWPGGGKFTGVCPLLLSDVPREAAEVELLPKLLVGCEEQAVPGKRKKQSRALATREKRGGHFIITIMLLAGKMRQVIRTEAHRVRTLVAIVVDGPRREYELLYTQ